MSGFTGGLVGRRGALRGLLGGAGLLLPLAGGCKRREMPTVELIDSDGVPPETEAIGALAPPWPPAVRVIAGNDLLVHWLVEEGSPAAHLRLLLPTHGLAIAGEPAAISAAAAVVAQAVALELQRWTQRYSRVDLGSAVDRLEIAVHVQEDRFDALLGALTRVLGLGDPRALLERAQATVAASLIGAEGGGEELALGALVGLLSGGDPAAEGLERRAVEALDGDTLVDAWGALLDPKRAVMVVHSGGEPRERGLQALAKAWTRGGLLGGLAKAPERAIDRLRPARGEGPAKGIAAPGRLRGDVTAPLHWIDHPSGSPGASLLVFGRILPLASPRERALARLAQRLLQEELDARLTIAGDRGIFVVRGALRRGGKAAAGADGDGEAKGKRRDRDEPRDPRARQLARLLDDYLAEVRMRHSPLRLAQAAELWLGARMVQASLTGEDWTALWSESIDLAENDPQIAGALARDAQAMLAITGDELVAWATEWLDVGDPSWAWVVVGEDRELPEALAGVATVVPLARG